MRIDTQMVLDPCAGGDLEHEMAYPAVLHEFGNDKVRTLDIRDDSPAQDHGDFLTLDPPTVGPYDLVITNPPFAIALDVIKHAMKFARYRGHVVMLLRLNFLGSQDRAAFFKNNMPVACYVHSKRMRFSDEGTGDSVEYMHAVWENGYSPESSKLRILQPPPAAPSKRRGVA